MSALPSNAEELAVCLADPMWRLMNLYKILIKGEHDTDNKVIQFKPNAAQLRFIERLWHRNLILKARQLGFCVDPSTRVLTADLRWARIADLAAGDEVVSVDEHPPGGRGKARRMRTATVQATQTVQRMAYRVMFDDGRSVVCTDMHPWLTRKAGDCAEWRSLSGKGNEVVGRIKTGTQVRWVAKPWDEPVVEDGWFGGMLDGEGSISKRNSSAGINVSQRVGPVWDRLVSYCEDRGYSHCIESDQAERLSKYGKVPVPKIAFGRMDEMFRVIGQTRPTRFIGNRFWEGRELPGKRNGDIGWATVTSIEPVGEQPMVDLQTSTGTYIAEGFVSHNTTLISLLWLDHALFNANQRCGIIAQDKEAAELIFRDKVKFAYENLPPMLKDAMPLARDSASELLFAHNNSSIRVATSMRSGTIDRLHVSEFGKICAKFPDKAQEVITGSLPAVPDSGVLVIESTAEGRDGDFYKMTQRAQAQHQQHLKLTAKDYRFHFYAWWQAPEYRLDSTSVAITDKEHDYFDKIEVDCNTQLDPDQRAWYIATRDSTFNGAAEKMWQEYPGTPEEAFQVSTEGNYYAKDMVLVRKRGGITRVPVLDLPVNTFWDIGNSDGCAVWFHQELRGEDRFIGYYEAHGETLHHYVKALTDTGYLFNKHFLPHDAAHKRLSDTNRSTQEMLQSLGLRNTVIVPIITDLMAGVQMVRKHIKGVFFDKEATAQGIQRLDGYKKKFSRADNRFTDEPDKSNGCTEGADAFRQYAQAKESGLITLAGSTGAYNPPPPPDWRL